jgi:hypothetical protein
MKTHMDRSYPIILDLQDQIDRTPSGPQYVFLYDDGPVFRAFLCEEVHVGKSSVRAMIGTKVVVKIPARTDWRMVHLESIRLETGATMEEAELRNLSQKRTLHNRLIDELDLKTELGRSLTPTEYSELGYNPKMYT